MRYLLATLGSWGDLHPFLALARALVDAGHDVELMANAPYRGVVEREGVRFTPLCSDRDHARTAAHPELWHPVRGFGVLWRHLAVPALQPVLERVSAVIEEQRALGADIHVLASPLAVGARLATAQLAHPLCSVYTAPANLRPLGDPMFVGPYRVPGLTPSWARRGLWWALDQWKLEPMARARIDETCHALGIAPVTGSLFGDWIHSRQGGLALFPERFGPADQVRGCEAILQSTFPRFRAGGDRLSAETEEFLNAGEPPVVVFGGSHAGPEGRDLIRWVAQAAQALGLRCIVLAKDAAADDGLPATSDRIIRVAHAPLGDLLPRALVFAHHGGVGSCAEGLAAGLPQLVMPFAYDQFDNAERLARMHASITIRAGKSAPGHLLAALQQAVQMPRVEPPAWLESPSRKIVESLSSWERRI